MTTTDAVTRFHLGLQVTDIDRSVRFYRTLLGAEPVRYSADLARFELDRPPLVVALYPAPQPAGGALNHAGLRLPDAPSLVAVQRRLGEAGIATQRQEGVECCYARQTKFWVTDPDRVLWEVYTLEGDLDHSGFDDPPPVSAVAATTWSHRLTDPLPDRIPQPDTSLDEVQLEGTFNAGTQPEILAGLLAEVFRSLKPGGRVLVRGLVADRPFPGVPHLPGIASLVQRVPAEGEPAVALARAGFTGLVVEAQHDVCCFGVEGVNLRELRLAGWKPGLTPAAAAVVYKGPFEQVEDENGTVFRRGVVTAVTAPIAARLKAGPAGERFAFLPPVRTE